MNRKLLYAIALLLYPVLGFSQIGIGSFIINRTTTSIIDSIASQTQLTTKIRYEKNFTIEHYMKDFTATMWMVDLRKDSSKYGEGDSRAFIDSLVKVFYINYFKIGKIPVRDMYLTFYKDTLTRLDCKYSEDFIEAVSFKFGSPVTKTEKKLIVCQNGYGAQTTNEEIERFYYWSNLGSGVSAHAAFFYKFDDKCKSSLYTSFSIENSAKYDALLKRDSKYKQAYENKLKQAEVEKYKGF